MIKRTRRGLVYFIAACVVATTTTPARATEIEPSVAELPSREESIVSKWFKDFYSPFVDPTALTLFAGGTTATLAILATHKEGEDKWLEEVADHKPLRRFSAWGDFAGQMIPNILYVGTTGIIYLINKDPLTQMRMEMMFRATLAATEMSTLLKATIREPRPTDDNELTSFPSGHSTSVFAFATIVAAMHGKYWGAAAYTLAAFTAFSRMNDNRHRLHDVVAGATLGSMYGLAIYRRMRSEKVPSINTAQNKFNYEIAPVLTDDGAMLGFSATF